MHKTMRKINTAERLTLLLGEISKDREHLQNQYFGLIAPSDEHMRISGEIYNLRVNMGEIQKTECPF